MVSPHARKCPKYSYSVGCVLQIVAASPAPLAATGATGTSMRGDLPAEGVIGTGNGAIAVAAGGWSAPAATPAALRRRLRLTTSATATVSATPAPMTAASGRRRR